MDNYNEMTVEHLQDELEAWKRMYKELKKENEAIKEEKDMLVKQNTLLQESNEKLRKYYDWDKEELMESCYWLARENHELKKEIDKLKDKRIFSSAEYDLITLTSTTPQWELRRK